MISLPAKRGIIPPLFGTIMNAPSSCFRPAPEPAKELLTATWKARMRGSKFNVRLDGFSNPDESAGPAQAFAVNDRVRELWMVDRRSFTNSFVNEKNQKSFGVVEPPRPLNSVSVKK